MTASSGRARAPIDRRRLLGALGASVGLPLLGSARARARTKGRWAPLAGTAPLASVYPPVGNWWGYQGPLAILKSWNGWAWDEATETAWLFGCGGHGDYGGNEVYRWRPAEGFVRLNDPDRLAAAVGKGDAKPVDAEGKPLERASSVHTYAAQVFLDGTVHRFGGSPAWRGNFSDQYWRLSTDTLEHHRGLTRRDRSGVVPAAAWDPASRRVFVHWSARSGQLFDPATDTVTHEAPLATYGAGSGYAIDPGRRLLVGLGKRESSRSWELVVYDLDDAGRWSNPRLIDLVAKTPTRAGRTLAYDPVGERVIVWLGGVYAFDGLAVSELPMLDDPPSVAPTWGNGVFNRFSWAPSLGGFVTVIHPDDAGMVLRLA